MEKVNTMAKQIIKPLIIALLLITLASMPACKKSGKECPLQTYNVECAQSSIDEVFGGYGTSTQQYTIQANCPEDAKKMAEDMSYNFGQSYKRCHVVP